MATLVLNEWINDIYTSLATTANDSDHNLSTGVSSQTFSEGSKLLASDINTLISNIQGLSSNYYLANYADSYINNATLSSISTGTKVLSSLKTQIDNYVEDILSVCANWVTTNPGGSGNTNYGNNFTARSGNTNYGNNFSAAAGNTNYGNNFTARSGNTNYGNNFSAATGNTNYGNNFTARSGNTNYGNNFSAAAGNTNNGNNFRSQTNTSCTNNGKTFTGFTNNSKTGTFYVTNYDAIVFFTSGTTQCGPVSGRAFNAFNSTNSTNFRVQFSTNSTNWTGFSTDSHTAGCTNNGNNFTARSGNTNYGNNFSAAAGNTNYGNNFTARSGNTNYGNNFSAAAGNTNNGNNFRACPTVRFDFSVVIGGTSVSNSNFTRQ